MASIRRMTFIFCSTHSLDIVLPYRNLFEGQICAKKVFESHRTFFSQQVDFLRNEVMPPSFLFIAPILPSYQSLKKALTRLILVVEVLSLKS